MRKLFVLLCLLLAMSVTRSVVFAQEIISSDSAGLNPTPSIDYTLPYPGILPDNPLYPLKAIRDRVVSLLIADPVKKSLFNLLQADKRLQSAVYLLYNGDAKHITLAESTISKGENYFDEAVSQIEMAQKRGKHVKEEITRMKIAAQKHDEVLTQIQSQVPPADKAKFTLLKERLSHIAAKINMLQKTN